IDDARVQEGAVGRPLLIEHDLRAAEVCAGAESAMIELRADDAVEADDRHYVLRTDRRLAVEIGELLRRQVDRDHAGEAAVRIVQPAAQPDQLPPRQAGVERRADIELATVLADMGAESRVSGNFEPRLRTGERGGD